MRMLHQASRSRRQGTPVKVGAPRSGEGKGSQLSWGLLEFSLWEVKVNPPWELLYPS